eukprot:symbB.v1.2.001835.t1/scaffold77.1/size347087/6
MLWGKEELGELCTLAKRTIVAYIRMAATVIIAVVVRLCLDCVGLILTRQDALSASFWPRPQTQSGGYGNFGMKLW